MKAPNRNAIPAAAMAALVAAFPASAEEPTVESLTRPQSEVEIGGAAVAGRTRRFGIYNGLSESGGYPLFEGTLNRRDDETGTWIRGFGKNDGFEGGRLGFEHERQGDWSYFLEGSRSTFSNPKIIRTPITGLGTTVNTLNTGAAPREVDLELNRENVKIGGAKFLPDGYKVDFSARTERKTGGRQWGTMGATAGSAFNFAVEPIEYLTQEYQGSVSYTGKQFQMQTGYLGSIFKNEAQYLRSVSTGEPVISLPSDNMMHQVFVNGGYSFTPTTRGTFQASYGLGTQDEGFFTPPTQPGNTRTDLGGKVHNSLVNLGLSSRPTTDVSTRLKLRHEERNDNTPLERYVPAAATRAGFNVPFSRTTTAADAEADYQLPMNFKLTGGVGYEHWERSSPPVRHTAFRKETDEVSARVSLRRPLLETLSGSVGYIRSERTGSDLQNDGTNLIDPILWANRSRDKGRLTLDWAPTSAFSMQFVGEASVDRYSARDLGPQDGNSLFTSLDASYKLSDDWELGGWLSLNQTTMHQRTRNSAGTSWEADLVHSGIGVGASVRNQLTERLKLIFDLQRTDDTSEHGIGSLGGTAGMGPSLPDIVYKQWLFGVTGDYALDENYGVKLKYAFAHTTVRDWTWQGYTYADGTAVQIPPEEQAHFVGLSFYFKW
jgi:MtrB/PioB family decaheme-associated outer membrane protein